MLDFMWYDWVGVAGTLMVIGAFFLLQAGKLSGTALSYQLLNLFGAAGVLVSLLGSFNLAVFLLEGAWVAISAYGIWRSMDARTGTRNS